MLRTTLAVAWLLWGAAALSVNGPSHGRCESITMPLCHNMPYNETIFPNLLGHTNQEEASRDGYKYLTLLKMNCSADIQLFLCAMFAPVCTILDRPLPPCRSLCESARKCESVFLKFGLEWPPHFQCDLLPISSRPDELCVAQTNSAHFPRSELERIRTSTVVPSRPSDYSSMMNFICPSALKVPHDLEYRLHIGSDMADSVVVPNCGAPCYKLFFGPSDISILRQVVGIAAIVAFVSCIFTLATFLLDMSRFPYPEKPIIFLTFCYMIVSSVLLVGFGSDDSIACNEPFHSSTINLHTERLLKQGTLHDWRCSVLGMLFYFFLMAGALWWLMLTVTWFLSAGLKWGQEAIDIKAAYLHGFVWTVASIQTTVVLVLKKIEGDILLGVCFVGILDSSSLLLLVIVPLLVYLCLGAFFLLLGIVSLVRIRGVMKRDGTKTDKLEKLIAKIGLFSALYMVPAFAMVACLLYEHHNLPAWMSQWQEDVCRHQELSITWQVPCRYPDGKVPLVGRPDKAIFLIKYLSIVLMAIFSGTWVWSNKTVNTWRLCYLRITGQPTNEAVEAYSLKREAHL